MGSNVSLDYRFSSTIDKVWAALTDSATLAKWVMDNDFKPIVGHRFQFRQQPQGAWDGVIHCEVLEVDAPRRLSYTWVSGGEDTIVTWTLADGQDGSVLLHLEHIGFSKPQALGGARYGWTLMGERLAGVLAWRDEHV
ncbi:SRPBCC domain-containing protein [Paenibacillus sp. YYML68]|uniref:SRPBCC family protein n=1 Tax=Paenibacillus sp. YYML68 TaxID=2909250 RepID=UPI00249380AF|nr:SRPBCC domain-containing protein [Paenibacillus sp. YYML68]